MVRYLARHRYGLSALSSSEAHCFFGLWVETRCQRRKGGTHASHATRSPMNRRGARWTATPGDTVADPYLQPFTVGHRVGFLARMQQPFRRFGEPVDRGWTDLRDLDLDAEPDGEDLRGHACPLGAIHPARA